MLNRTHLDIVSSQNACGNRRSDSHLTWDVGIVLPKNCLNRSTEDRILPSRIRHLNNVDFVTILTT
jgi:hypothetical protein